MAFYDYSLDKNLRSDGYTGIRVVVAIDGNYNQRYFAQERYSEAVAYHKKLLKEKAAWRRQVKTERAQTCRNGTVDTMTGVAGLRIRVERKSGRGRAIYYRCIISLSANDSRGKHSPKSFIVTKDTLAEQWKNACKQLASYSGLKRAPKAWIDKCPSPSCFTRTIRDYKKTNSIKDIGFLGLPKSKYPTTHSY